MSYLTQDKIASSTAMLHRVAACYAGEQSGAPDQMEDPDRWAYTHRRYWSAAPDWDDAWEYSLNSNPPPDPLPDPYVPYDPGTNEAVITDAQILAQVQSMLS
jgi:hypothetical protein